jgi:hypothetical protein
MIKHALDGGMGDVAHYLSAVEFPHHDGHVPMYGESDREGKGE